jgi:predicted nuclease of predicted toxin-antitoxin system
MPWKELNEPSDDDQRWLKHEFPGKARFLVDENTGPEVTYFLRNLGYNAKFTSELGLSGRSDEEVFAAAWRDNRVIISHDSDFMDDRRFPHHRNPGLVVVGPGASGREDEQLISCLHKAILLAGRNAAWFKGKKLYFKSPEALTIKSSTGRDRYLWTVHGMPKIWTD